MLGNAPSVVIWNPSAGTSETPEAVALRRELELVPDLQIREPGTWEQSVEVVADAVQSGCQLIISAGGDGTVNACVNALMKVDAPVILGVLPLGTGNDLARNLGLPLDLQSASQVLRTGTPHSLDVIHLQTDSCSRWYANMLTGGNTGRYLEQMTDDVKQQWGPFCYLRGVVDVVGDLQRYHVEVCCDDGPPQQVDVLNVFAANGPNTGAGLTVSPHAKLDDGLIDLVIVRDGAPIEIADLTATYLLADFLEHDLVWFQRAKKIKITASPPLELTADGDSVGATPISLTCQRSALMVLRP
ncbi:MAG: YegS/Rv2252/BmrU family lipid kinase [Planctomycetaceae bacterium]|nr:YegS/Rv2252/BmrU family lipid kinase [Planctomycetaceae bacterium]